MDVNIILLIVVILITLSLGSLNYMENMENFENNDKSFDIDVNLENLAKALSGHTDSSNNLSSNMKPTSDHSSSSILNGGPADVVARAWCKDRCPVDIDSDRNDWVRKSQISEDVCPPMPDLSEYVLKSSIPPIQKCPPCICPKVQVQAGLCESGNGDSSKECGPCPPPERCDQSICPECKYYGVLTVTDIDKAIEEMAADKKNVQNMSQLHRILNKIAKELKDDHAHEKDLHGTVDGSKLDGQGMHKHNEQFRGNNSTEEFLDTDDEYN